MNEQEFLKARLRELSSRAYQRDILQHTAFLGMSEQAVFLEHQKEFTGTSYCLYGGHEEAERRVIAFLPSYIELPPAETEGGADKEADGEADRKANRKADGAADRKAALFSDIIACVRIRPRNEKFSDALTHRDYLGALMNLGIEREKLGDILTDGTEAYLFCMADIAPYLCENLNKVRHTSVSCEQIAAEACGMHPQYEELSVNVASERLDAVISAVWKLSRGISAELIAGEKVFVDGKTARQAGSGIPQGTRVSVRGYGKFIYEGAERETKKGRLYVRVRRFADCRNFQREKQ